MRWPRGRAPRRRDGPHDLTFGAIRFTLYAAGNAGVMR
jgi:hypothetical protein